MHSWLKIDDMDHEISEANWILVRDLKVRVYVIIPMNLNNYDMTIGLLIPAEIYRRQRVNQWQMVMFGFPKGFPF